MEDLEKVKNVFYIVIILCFLNAIGYMIFTIAADNTIETKPVEYVCVDKNILSTKYGVPKYYLVYKELNGSDIKTENISSQKYYNTYIGSIIICDKIVYENTTLENFAGFFGIVSLVLLFTGLLILPFGAMMIT